MTYEVTQLQCRNPNPNPDHRLLQHNTDRLWHSVENYYRVKFQDIPIRGFRFIVLTYTPTHTHTHIVTKWSPYPRRRTTSSTALIMKWHFNMPRYPYGRASLYVGPFTFVVGRPPGAEISGRLVTTFHCRRPSFSSCWPSALEHSAVGGEVTSASSLEISRRGLKTYSRSLKCPKLLKLRWPHIAPVLHVTVKKTSERHHRSRCGASVHPLPFTEVGSAFEGKCCVCFSSFI